MCLGKKTLFRVGENAHRDSPPDHNQRHHLDSFYNFFARPAWTKDGLARGVGLLALTRLNFTGCITLLVDDTLLHKTGRCVWGLGWFRDAVASTRNRVAPASGHNRVVLAVAFYNPLTKAPILALPLLCRLHRSGKDHPSCPALALEMLALVLDWFPTQRFTLVGDGAYAASALLSDLPERVALVGRMRGDAAGNDPRVPQAPKGKRGRKATKGARLPDPKEAARKADRKRTSVGSWLWQVVGVSVYGKHRSMQTVSYEAVWPHVLGLRPIKIVGARPYGGDGRHLPVHDGSASRRGMGDHAVRVAVEY